MGSKMDCFGLTDTGKVREGNEDQFLVADLNKSMLIHQTSLSVEDHTRLFGGSQGKLLLVADGMGGHAAGRQASTVAVEGLAQYVLNTMPWFYRLRHDREDDLEEELRSALEHCQKRVEEASAAPGRRGMGTTLTMAWLLWPRLYVVHAGDSRCYLLRGARLEQVTTDHTLAQKLVERGELSPEEAHESRASHLLYNCIGGGSPDLSVDVYKASLRLGDTLLLCTDGLTALVSDARIRDVLLGSQAAEEACRALIGLANDLGGTDNITVVVAYFRDAVQAAQQALAQAAAEEEEDPARSNGESRAEEAVASSAMTG
jgi:protein phosphatase